MKCGGDLVLDQPDWLCLQCGTYYYTGLYQGTAVSRSQPVKRTLPPMEKSGTGLLPSGLVNRRNDLEDITVDLGHDSDAAVVMLQA